VGFSCSSAFSARSGSRISRNDPCGTDISGIYIASSDSRSGPASQMMRRLTTPVVQAYCQHTARSRATAIRQSRSCTTPTQAVVSGLPPLPHRTDCCQHSRLPSRVPSSLAVKFLRFGQKFRFGPDFTGWAPRNNRPAVGGGAGFGPRSRGPPRFWALPGCDLRRSRYAAGSGRHGSHGSFRPTRGSSPAA